MQKKSSYYAQLSATPAFLIVSESLVQVLWKWEDILNSSLWFKMSGKSKINSERHMNHIKHIDMQRIYYSLSVQPLCQQHVWKQNMLPSHVFWWPGDFPISQEDEFGGTRMISNKHTDSKDDGKRKCSLPVFLQRKVQWLMCDKEHTNQRQSMHFASDRPKLPPQGSANDN